MARATPAQYDVARCLLAEEGSSSERPAGVLAADRTCEKLREGLSKILGPAGFHALLSRALHLAQAEHPFLRGIRVTDGACLAGLAESVAGQDPARIHEAFVTLFGDFYWLLSSFIGEDLAQRQVRRIWPGLPPCGASPAAEETGR